MFRLRIPLFPSMINVIAMLFLAVLTACGTGGTERVQEPTDTKEVQITLQDIRNKQITYDFYQVRGSSDLEYIATEVADRDGQTVVKLEVDKDINNIIVKRTKGGVEKRQVVPLRSGKVVVQFLL